MKKIIIISLISISALADNMVLKLGYPFIFFQSNKPTYLQDFSAINVGASYIKKIDDTDFLSFFTEFAMAINVKNLETKLDGEIITGRSSVRINTFGVLYTSEYSEDNFLSIGPIVAQTTLKYDTFKVNTLDVKKFNRLITRQYGARVGYHYYHRPYDLKFEIAYSFLRRSGFSIVENSSLDTNVIKSESEIGKRDTSILSFNVLIPVF